MAAKHGTATVAQLDEFDERVDVRSPAEFAEDHVPGALNCPALDNAQRARVGTLYKQVSPFEARRLGGELVARNLADAIGRHFSAKPKNWRPLIYCWRGGERSGAFVTWLRLIGWDACKLEGGYKRFRAHVMEELARLAPALDLRVVCGATGCAKTRLIEALAARGEQVIDLEGLAAHKGSVLGALPGTPQPAQKHFETLLWQRVRALDATRPVFIEAESRKIGNLQVPEPLILHMRASNCIEIDAPRDARLEFLLRDYAYLADDLPALREKLGYMSAVQSRETLEQWQALAGAGDLAALFAELIDRHYDPLYRRSQNRSFTHIDAAKRYVTDSLTPAALEALAARVAAGV